MKTVREIRLVLGDQLNLNHSWFDEVDDSVLYFMAEQHSETDYTLHHAQKLIAVLSAMRDFASQLKARGHLLLYWDLDHGENRQNFRENLGAVVAQSQAKTLSWQRPDEWRLVQELGAIGAELARDRGVEARQVSSEHFLATAEDFLPLVKNAKPPRMETFYRRMRKKTGYLMNDAGPLGGTWNYDQANRKAFDQRIPVPEPWMDSRDESKLWATIRRRGVGSFGEPKAENFPWPKNRHQALQALERFIDHRLPRFGPFQDAMDHSEPYLFHSLISFALNTKMIHPAEVIEAALDRWEDEATDDPELLASLEGFVRQILGWREYMHNVYQWAMPGYEQLNHFGADRPLPAWYWTGDTKMHCLACSVGDSLKNAYAHHIQRLMVTGNFALMAGIDPDQVDQWYLGVYIDAFQWVEITNTRGMSQWADGGMVATKPYAASARYISSMSDYCSHCSYDQKKRHGTGACPFNSLYWHFVQRNGEALRGNHRMAMVYKSWERMDPDERKKTLAQADEYLSQLDHL